ncbi:unnamed protein product [Paramecium octaurelia]|uniref:Uncharacterized protein n=1 Tax=Paramecium octaurelia TaxID=43137 RepID=A0A8S1WSG6_PAROT|nr:unnamed protein product [Paramecium octaurelia]
MECTMNMLYQQFPSQNQLKQLMYLLENASDRFYQPLIYKARLKNVLDNCWQLCDCLTLFTTVFMNYICSLKVRNSLHSSLQSQNQNIQFDTKFIIFF